MVLSLVSAVPTAPGLCGRSKLPSPEVEDVQAGTSTPPVVTRRGKEVLMESGALLRAEVVLLLMLAVVVSAARTFAQESKQPRVGGPYLAAIVVPELETSADWYQKHLGF